LWPRREKFAELFGQWTELKARQKKLQQQEQDRELRRDLLSFQLQEIRESSVTAGEDEELAAEKKILRSSDTLMELGRLSHEILADTVVSSIAQVRRNLEQMAQYDPAAREIADRVTSSSYELDDVAHQLSKYLDNIPSDPLRLEEIEARIDVLQKLKRKYGGPQMQLAEVLHYADRAAQELDELDSMDQKLAEIGRKLAGLERELTVQADSLSGLRRESAAELEASISRELSTLSFSTAEFKAEFRPAGNDLQELTQSGRDRVEFMFSANPGEPLKPLVKIASGGELSRLLLGLKCILARRDRVGTVIFDEVDAGIGGQAAEDIARKIKQLSGHHQVLCITHLPQIASKADEHFRVHKILQNKRTRTEITLLDDETRIPELARMLAGESVSEETIAFARGLLKKGRGTEAQRH
jgi:DNA repair protein RecN (Recombination protein N)